MYVKSLSNQVTQEEMNEGRTYPNLARIQTVSLKIAIDVATYAFERNLCHVYPVPESIGSFIESKVYKTD